MAQTLADTLRQKNITISPDFNYGDIQRDGSQWLRAQEYQVNGKMVRVVHFGDWRADYGPQRWAGHEDLSPEEKKELNTQMRAKNAMEKAARDALALTVSIETRQFFAGLTDRGSTPYLAKKGLTALFGAKIEVSGSGLSVIVPAGDVEDVLWGYQTIAPDGQKRFREGMKKEGCFHLMGKIYPEGIVHICEGFATAASVSGALAPGSTVVCAFDAGNLLPVGKALRAKYPELQLLYCADNDQWTTKPNGSPWNPGVEKANQAARETNGKVVKPRFKDTSTRPTDFNDLQCLEGILEVLSQVKNPQTESLSIPPPPKKKSETEIALEFIPILNGDVMKQEKNLFEYDGKRWVELGVAGIDKLKNKLNRFCGNSFGDKQLSGLFNTLVRQIPHVPKGINLYAPNPRVINFLDKTIHLIREKGSSKLRLEPRAHTREDYICNLIPVDYPKNRKTTNKLWEEALEQALSTETPSQKALMIRALRQMGGALLMPNFAQIFVLHGISGSRKSTLALTLLKVLDAENVSWVEPCKMQGFELQGMINKLVNCDTDLDKKKPLPDSILKKLIDDAPQQINRKGKDPIAARLAKVWILLCDGMPPNRDYDSRAYERRFTILGFKGNLTNDCLNTVEDHYENIILESGIEGVVNFMLDGLDDLVENSGRFTRLESSQKALEEWGNKHADPLTRFMIELRSQDGVEFPGNKFVLGEKESISKTLMWQNFCQWLDATNKGFVPSVSQNALGRAMKKHFQDDKDSKDTRIWLGVGIKPTPNSIM